MQGAGITPPNSIVGNTDPAAQQVLQIANDALKNISFASSIFWNKLQREFQFDISSASVSTLTRSGNVGTVTTAVPHNLITGNIVLIQGAVQTEYNGNFIIQVTGLTSFQIAVVSTATTPATGTIVYYPNAFPLPDDFQSPINMTYWDRLNRWPLDGPMSPALWQRYVSGIVTPPVKRIFRIRNDKVEIFPINISAATNSPFVQRIALEYLTNQIVLAVDGVTTKEEFTVDTDTAVIGDHIVKLYTRFKFLAAKGLSYADAQQEYNDFLKQAVGSDQGAMEVDMGTNEYLMSLNIPETGYGQSN